MEIKHKLLPNSKITLFDSEEFIEIYPKRDFIKSSDLIFDVKKKQALYIEELLSQEENNANLFIIKKTELGYIAIFKNIKFDHFNKVTEKEINMKNIPEQLTEAYYLYQSQNDNMCLFNKYKGEKISLEKMLRKCLEANDLTLNKIEINCFDKEKNPNLFEVILQIEEVETIHLYLNLGDELEVYKTFYSEMCGGKEYTLLKDKDDSDYINFLSSFCTQLKNHPLLKEIKYIKDYQQQEAKNEKSKIRSKMKNKMLS